MEREERESEEVEEIERKRKEKRQAGGYDMLMKEEHMFSNKGHDLKYKSRIKILSI